MSENTTIYFPAMYKNYSSTNEEYIRLGIDVNTIRTFEEAQRVKDMGANMVVLGDIRWDWYQPTQDGPVYNQAFSIIDQRVDWFDELGIEMQLHIHYAPDWATLYPDKKGPIKTEYMPLWYNWVEAVVDRYYPKVKRFQLWNEPELSGWGSENAYEFHNMVKGVYSLMYGDPNIILTHGTSSHLYMWEKLCEYGIYQYIKDVNYHHYAIFDPTKDTSGRPQEWYVSPIPNVNLIREYCNNTIPVNVTETCLLNYGESTPDYEIAKANWFDYVIPELLQAKVNMVLGYGYRSNWNNANIIGYPAEDVLIKYCMRFAGAPNA